MSYEGLDDEEKLKMVPVNNQNNNHYYVVSDSESDGEDEEKIFYKDVKKEVEANPMTAIKAKVVHAMKNLLALFNDNANKTVKNASQEKSANKNLNF